MPTQTAYEVLTGNSRIAYARPTMLRTADTPNVSDGARRVNPSDRPRAVAHTASSTPDTTNTSHDIPVSLASSCRTPGTTPLVREPVGLWNECLNCAASCANSHGVSSGAHHLC